MADNEEKQEEKQAKQKGTDTIPQQFVLQRIFVKDISFESPQGAAAFQQEWKPHITFNLNSKNTKLGEELYEVVLVLSVEAKHDDKTSFLVEVHQAGIFMVKGFEGDAMDHVMGSVCPNILFPYARETIDNLVIKGSFPPVMLSPVNFDALFMQAKEKRAEQQAAETTSH